MILTSYLIGATFASALFTLLYWFKLRPALHSTKPSPIKFAWHIHHHRLIERIEEPLRIRRRYIRKYKDDCELDLRLRLLKPVKNTVPTSLIAARQLDDFKQDILNHHGNLRNAIWRLDPTYSQLEPLRAIDKKVSALITQIREVICDLNIEAEVEIEALHAEECPNCPWDGRTIFPEPHNHLSNHIKS